MPMTLKSRRTWRWGSEQRLDDLRLRMISQTNAFLTWALAGPDRVPRIPRRRVDVGGFTVLLKRPGVKQQLEAWWYRTLDRLERLD